MCGQRGVTDAQCAQVDGSSSEADGGKKWVLTVLVLATHPAAAFAVGHQLLMLAASQAQAHCILDWHLKGCLLPAPLCFIVLPQLPLLLLLCCYNSPPKQPL